MEELAPSDSPSVTDEYLCRRIAALSRQKQLPREAKDRIVATLKNVKAKHEFLPEENPPRVGE